MHFDIFSHLHSNYQLGPLFVRSVEIQKKSRSIAENLDLITDKMPEETAALESEIDIIENKLNPPESEKVTTKRQRRRRVTKPK